jgi:aromatic ring-cleaving dioxygenase
MNSNGYDGTFLLANRNPFDIHFYFTKETTESALDIRKRFSEKFPFLTFYDVNYEPMGPHHFPMWEADFTNSKDLYADLGRTVIWLMEHRKEHSILIHPHTGNPLLDHTINPIWLGDKLPLKTEVL